MGAPQNRAERGRVSVQPIYSVNQMPETGAGCRRKEPQVRAQTSTGTPQLDISDAVSVAILLKDMLTRVYSNLIIKDDLNNIFEDSINKVTPQL